MYTSSAALAFPLLSIEFVPASSVFGRILSIRYLSFVLHSSLLMYLLRTHLFLFTCCLRSRGHKQFNDLHKSKNNAVTNRFPTVPRRLCFYRNNHVRRARAASQLSITEHSLAKSSCVARREERKDLLHPDRRRHHNCAIAHASEIIVAAGVELDGWKLRHAHNIIHEMSRLREHCCNPRTVAWRYVYSVL